MSEQVLVEVRDSPIHGKGVFAKRDIKAGAYVCFYDGDIVDNTEDEDEIIKTFEYSQEIDNNKRILGYKIPRHVMGIGQLINDSIDLKLSDNLLDSCAKYGMESLLKTNVTINNGKFFTICDIKKDEELFHHYGHCFWMIKLGINKKERRKIDTLYEGINKDMLEVYKDKYLKLISMYNINKATCFMAYDAWKYISKNNFDMTVLSNGNLKINKITPKK